MYTMKDPYEDAASKDVSAELVGGPGCGQVKVLYEFIERLRIPIDSTGSSDNWAVAYKARRNEDRKLVRSKSNGTILFDFIGYERK